MPESQKSTSAPACFVTTHWSVVLAARDKASPDSEAALEALCRTYWYPLYAFIRRLGRSPEDAQDLTQEFFARLLQKDYLQAAAQERGRFRTFLRVALKRFLANEWDRQRALKRGGGVTHFSIDTGAAEERYLDERMEAPDQLYERRWAMTLLDQALARLRAEYLQSGKQAEFQELKEHLTGERGSIPYEHIAASLGQTEGAVRVAVHRLRKRFRELLRATVSETVSGPEEVQAELRHLVTILSEG
jgi:RNA polymerase sigma factor (sigma-70 family)